MKNISILVVLLILTLFINAQTTPPSIQWQKSLGGTQLDYGYSIRQTKDGGYIVAGWTFSDDGDVSGNHDTTGNNGDAWIVKIDSSGNIQWQKCYGGSDDDGASSILQTNDGGYIFAGFASSSDGDLLGISTWSGIYYGWVVKIDSLGNIQWQDGVGPFNHDEVNSIQSTSDGGYILTGCTNSGYDIFVTKLDSSGSIQWQRVYGGIYLDDAESIQQTIDGGFIFAGITQSNDGDVSGNHGSEDYWVVKLNNSGYIQWQKCLGGTGSDWGSFIQQTSDRGYIVSGSSSSNDGDVTGNHGSADYWVVKLDTVGNIVWQKSIGGSNSDGYIESPFIKQTNDRGYIVAGFSYSNDGDITSHHGTTSNSDYWVVKLDSLGNIQWEKSLGGTANEGGNFQGTLIQPTNDGGYILGGYSNSNNGDVSGNHGGYDYWVVKLGPASLNIKEQKNASNISIYPNPAYRKFKVNFPIDTKYIVISNSLGQELEKRYVFHEERVNFEIKDDGFYFVRIVTSKESITKKIIISK